MKNEKKNYCYYFMSGKVAFSNRPLTVYEVAELEAKFGELLTKIYE